jgi:hypothetical protein
LAALKAKKDHHHSDDRSDAHKESLGHRNHPSVQTASNRVLRSW